MNIQERISPSLLEFIKESISEADSNEVLFLGKLGEDKLIDKIEVGARGDENSVPAIFPHMIKGDVVIHNHPSGVLTPSSADLNVASLLGQDGIGFYIINNEATKVYPVVEPIILKKREHIGSISDLLKPGGRLDTLFSDYEYRESQANLLEDVTKALNSDSILIAEAGTGVGKSFAYLVPAIKWAETNEERVVISTGTINLQQQLIEKDIPLAKKILDSDIKTVLVKGRGNYICHKRLYSELEEDSLFRDENDPIYILKDWIKNSPSGSITELNFKPTRELWSSVCSESETCTGIKCSYFNQCYSFKARKEASTAGVIVVNHHLLFADLEMRRGGAGYESSAILPPFSKIIFDEAHNIEDSATSFFSQKYNKFSLIKDLNRLLGNKGGKRYGSLVKLDRVAGADFSLADIIPIIKSIKECADNLDALCIDFTGAKNYRIEGNLKEKDNFGILEPGLKLQKSILELTKRLSDELKEIDEEFHEYDSFIESVRLKSKLESVAAFFEKFRSYLEYHNDVFWLDSSRTSKGDTFVNYWITPLDISNMMCEAVFEPYSSVIATSATLTINNSFNFWKSRVGLNYIDPSRVSTSIYHSPFNYEERVHLAVPVDIPLPNDDNYIEACTEYIKSIVLESMGSALILFTSYFMLKEVYSRLEEIFLTHNITCYRQGDDDRTRLLNNFKKDLSSVLFATESFWEGVDSPGETLKIVIITKLPFRVPTDPIVKARMDFCTARGGNPFMDISVPEAVTRLKQGFGRLMRRKSDWGAVYILDGRTVKKRYGSIFLNSLPKCDFTTGDKSQIIYKLQSFLERGKSFE